MLHNFLSNSIPVCEMRFLRLLKGGEEPICFRRVVPVPLQPPRDAVNLAENAPSCRYRPADLDDEPL